MLRVHLTDACVCCASMQVMLTLFIAIGGGLVAAFLSYHLALTAAGLTTYELVKQQQAMPCSDGVWGEPRHNADRLAAPVRHAA